MDHFRITSPVPTLPCITAIQDFCTIIHYYITLPELASPCDTIVHYCKYCLSVTLHLHLLEFICIKKVKVR